MAQVSECATFWAIFKHCAITHISTRSTLTPHGSVASSRLDCMIWEIVSRSLRISARFLVPSTFLRVVAAKSRVEWLEKKGTHVKKTSIKRLILEFIKKALKTAGNDKKGMQISRSPTSLKGCRGGGWMLGQQVKTTAANYTVVACRY